jgi:hypothetical protein
MLGAIKGDAAANVSLFRRLSRRWRPLARVGRERPSLAVALGSEKGPKPAPAWIGVRRPPPAAAVAPVSNAKRSGSTWNPWLWVK